MPKRKRSHPDSPPAGTTFSFMDGSVDMLEGLAMHEEVISEQHENELISFVQTQCAKGRKGELKKPTYLRASGARSQNNQREMIMYGGFFDFNRARPGKRGLVPPFPPILEKLVDHLVSKKYLPSDVRPDSCIINQYDKGDCIPPHVDHSSYYRPISTLSLLGEEPMLVGSRFRTVRSCTWAPTCGKAIPLPRRSLLVLGGNSGNIAKHCVSACRGPRISITLRKQPPPDWKPDISELVGKGGGIAQRGDSKSKSKCRTNEGTDERPKNKSLSGSAKRRKKMMKQGGRISQIKGEEPGKPSEIAVTKSNSSVHACTSKNVDKGSPKERRKSNKTKNSDKQARRNARRLEKKRAAAASCV
eukprot:CAMPEP_0181140124 /NCGR_PEP_ID=MMETSP1071-20121207/35143_1 /TAXON_ID=35127 /ORGANISM="Thalassiosira sp., Strain NH16" /LENGTH=358 /DNA_ID=CAMNT_0023227067 /DNA_START=98 /DNA_END=1174 /DNA_ORIENTATION=-